MLIGGLDNKIEEIKKNINESLQSFTEAELKLKEAEKKTADLDKKINEDRPRFAQMASDGDGGSGAHRAGYGEPHSQCSGRNQAGAGA